MSRPLIGEPLPLDLVNTWWNWQGARVDHFDDLGNVRAWLDEHGLPADGDLDRARELLVESRTAMRKALAGDEESLNSILRHGSRRPLLKAGVVTEEVIVDDPAWRAAWIAAADLVRLVGERGERVRKCANPECVLWFDDVSKNGRRRWCSMETCGNRAKVNRYNQRHS